MAKKTAKDADRIAAKAKPFVALVLAALPGWAVYAGSHSWGEALLVAIVMFLVIMLLF